MGESVLVFVGDSITDSGRRTDPEGLGDGYVRHLVPVVRAEYARIVNAGIAGNRIRDLRARWETDVIAERPDVLSVYVGVNDTWRRFDEGDATSAEAFDQDYRAVLDRAREAGVRRLVLVEPFLLPVRAEQEAWLPDLDEKRAVVAALANDYGAAFVPLQGVLSAASGGDNVRLAPDGVHPSAEGTALITQAWLDATA